MSESVVRIGLIGLGNVGQGVINVLRTNAGDIERRLGRKMVVTKASARDLSRPRQVSVDGIELVSDPFAIVRDPEVDLVVEAIGGQQPAKDLIVAALEAGKPVATANKALLAEDGNSIFAAAAKAGAMVAFEAAVAGGIPIIKALREGLAANEIQEVAGIINGTCNYVLSQMAAKGQSYDEALADAQKLGFAEADPTFDVEGVDAAHKLTIMASMAFGIPLNLEKVHCQGISQVTALDIQNADALGYRIKLLGIAKRQQQGVELRVHPTLVPDNHLLAKVDGGLNCVLVQGRSVGPVGFYGYGAGGDPTASAVVADLIDAARSLGSANAAPALGFLPDRLQAQPIVPIQGTISSYYLRLRAADEPGVLKAITSALAEFDISIEAILQKEPREHEDATIALITSEVSEARFEKALARVSALSLVREQPSHIRVEHFNHH